MVPRYTPSDFATLWSSEKKFATWLRVELAACEAMERHGLVPEGTAASLQHVAAKIDPSAIDEIEKETRHDVIAFLTHVERLGGAPARWLHRGMTSSDVLDTSFALLLTEASDLLIDRTQELIGAFRVRVEEHRRTPAIGRSHGIHAEPLTFGLILAGHMAEMVRAYDRLVTARDQVAVGKIGGAVGTYAHLSLEIERDALASLGLRPETVATQVVARDRHAALFSALGLAAAAIERFGTNVRHWQRTEVGEAEEAFSVGQKGSSAMPHKRNPVLTENVCGLARVVRASVVPALENVSLWHERDISHSSVERMIAPDATSTLAFMLDRTKRVVENLVVYTDRLQENIDKTGGLWASEGILLALVGKGLGRQPAYAIVQRNAMAAFRGEGTFETLLLADAEVTSHLNEREVREAFDLNRAIRHVDLIIDRAIEKVPT